MSYDCTWDECTATFTRLYSLKRHVSNVHKKEPRKKGKRNDDLKRRSYECSKCAKTFTSRDNCRRHEKTVHGELKIIGSETILVKNLYMCAYCGLQMPRKDQLQRHIYQKHCCTYENVTCHDCGREFKCKSAVKRHILKVHLERRAYLKRRDKCCLLCQELFLRIDELKRHLVKQHNVSLDPKTLSFSSMQEFLKWKKELEDSTITRFPIASRSKDKLTIVYECHRSGTYTEKSSGRKRAPFLRGSKKLNGLCPASITLCMKDSSYTVKFVQTHLGHAVNDLEELKYAFLRKEERQKLAGLIASGVSKRRILDDQLKGSGSLLDDSPPTNVVGKKLLSHKDLWNVEASFNVKNNENFDQHDKQDSNNVEVVVKQYEDGILLYNREGETCPEKFSDYEVEDDFSIRTQMCNPKHKHRVLISLRERQPEVPQNFEFTEAQEIFPPVNMIDETIDEPAEEIIEMIDVNIAESTEESTETVYVNIAESAKKYVDEAANERLKNQFELLLSKLSSREDQIMLQNQLQYLETYFNAKNEELCASFVIHKDGLVFEVE